MGFFFKECRLRILMMHHFSLWFVFGLLYMLAANMAWVFPMISACQQCGLEFCLLDGFVNASTKFNSCFLLILPYLVLMANSFVFRYETQYVTGSVSRRLFWKREIKFLLVGSLVWVLIIIAAIIIITMPFVTAINTWGSENGFFYLSEGEGIITQMIFVGFAVGIWLLTLIFGIIVITIHWLSQNVVTCYMAILLMFGTYQILPIPNPLLSYTGIRDLPWFGLGVGILTLVLVIITALIFRFRAQLIDSKDFYG